MRRTAGRPVARSFVNEQFRLVKEFASTGRTSAAFHDATCCWVTTPETWG